MAKSERSGDPQRQDANVEVEMLAADDPVAVAHEGGVPATSPDASPDTSVVSGRAIAGGRRGLVTVAGGVALTLVAVVGMLVGIDRAAPEPPPDRSAFDQPSGLVTTTTLAPADRNRVITVPPTAPPTTLAPGQYLLGQETGLWLFFGGDTTLQRLDLDNGEVVDYGMRAAPIATTGEDLVLFSRAAGLVGWIPAAVPGQQPFAWKPGYAAPGSEPGRLWVLDPEQDSPHRNGVEVGYGSWELFDTRSATAKELDQRPGDLYRSVEDLRPTPDELPAPAAALRPGPALSTRPDMLAAYTEEGYQQTYGGPVELLAFDKNRMLLRDCASEPCVVGWFSIDGDPVDRDSLDRDGSTQLPTQRPAPDVLWANFVGGGRWLLAYYSGGRSELVEVEGTGRFRLPPGANPAISDNGRWVAIQTDGQYAVLDATTGDEVYRFGSPVPDGPPGDPTSPADNGLLFVAKQAGAAE